MLVDGVDGSREQCVEMATRVAKSGGIVLLHDAGRTEYQPFIEKYPHKKLSEGEIPFPNGFFAHRGIVQFIV